MAASIRDRIVELRRLKASQLKPNEDNWRTHPQIQREVMQTMLDEIGIADALLARELPDGQVELIDGHLRHSLDPEVLWPVLILDLNDEEATKLLLTLDPLAAQATTDQAKLASLLDQVKIENEAVTQMLSDLLDSEPVDANKDGERLAKLQIDGYEPRHDGMTGDHWKLSDQHDLLIADIFTEWQNVFEVTQAANDPHALLIPYASPLVPLSLAGSMKKLVMIQPVPYVASILLDWWEDTNGENSTRRVV